MIGLVTQRYPDGMVLGPVLGSGRTSQVYAVDDQRVLRRMRAGIDISGEAAALSYAVAHGYPAPRLYEVRGQDMLMQRLHGPTMLTAVMTGQLPVGPAAAILADLLRSLHRLPSSRWRTWPEACSQHSLTTASSCSASCPQRPRSAARTPR